MERFPSQRPRVLRRVDRDDHRAVAVDRVPEPRLAWRLARELNTNNNRDPRERRRKGVGVNRAVEEETSRDGKDMWVYMLITYRIMSY